jgi:hypothetical protein
MNIKILFLILLIIPFVHAEDLSLAKTSYQNQETLQAEINPSFNIENDLTISKITLKKSNKIYPINPVLTKLSTNRYYLYFNLPNLENGVYTLNIEDLDYIEENQLKRITLSKEFRVDNQHQFFDQIKENYETNSLSDKELALTALSLKNVYPSTAFEAIDELILKQSSLGCYPKEACNIENTAFALLALKEFNKFSTKTSNWLKGAENNLDIGKIILQAPNCNENITSEIEITNNEINLTCSETLNIKLYHRYLGNDYLLTETHSDSFYYLLNNGVCYGSSYRSSCNFYTTALTNYILNQVNENSQTAYLANNKSDQVTLHQAFLVLLTNSQYEEDWLINNIQNNYWAEYSASLDTDPHILSTLYSYLALKDNEIAPNIKNYLLSQSQHKELVTYYLLNDKEFQNSIRIQPAIILSNDTKLIITNNRNNQVNISINSDFLKKDYVLTNTLTINLKPLKTTQLEIKYGDKSYYVPIILDKINSTSPIVTIPKASILSKEKTISSISFKDLLPNAKYRESIIVQLENLNSVNVKLDGSIKDILILEKDTYTNNEEIILHINQQRNATGNYEGTLTIYNNDEKLNSINIELLFTQAQQQKEQNITTSNVTTSTPSVTNKEKSSSTFWWVVLIIIIILILVAAFVIIKAKGTDKGFNNYLKQVKNS